MRAEVSHGSHGRPWSSAPLPEYVGEREREFEGRLVANAREGSKKPPEGRHAFIVEEHEMSLFGEQPRQVGDDVATRERVSDLLK